MRFFAAAAFLICIPSTAVADLSWEFAEQREREMEEVLEQRSEIEAIAERERARQKTREPSPAEQQAYQELGQALASHPEMAEANQAEHAATEVYQTAVKGGNSIEISLALQALAKAKTARYQKAASIPELKLAIDKWQQAAAGDADSPEAQSGLEAIQSKLKALSELLGQ